MRYDSPGGPGELRADLTIACDGRWSLCRREGGLVPREYPVDADVWWFRLPKAEGVGDTLLPRFKDGLFLGVIPRKDYLQTGYFLRKGVDAQLRARGIEALRRDIVTAIPELFEAVNGLESMDDVKLLDIRLNRLRRWYTNGLLCIGDAAHAMSPAGGVGINMAVQDAVAAARLLAAPLREHRVTAKDLAAVQRRREFPTAVTQTFQRFLHALMRRAIDSGKTPSPNKLLRVVARFPQLSVIPAYLMGVGVRPEHAPEFARRAPQPVSAIAPTKRIDAHGISASTVGEVPADVVEAALRAAESLGRDVADVPLIAIAREAGMSRSTLIRRLNGSGSRWTTPCAPPEWSRRPAAGARTRRAGGGVADQRPRPGRRDIGSGCSASRLLGTQPVCGVRWP